MQPAIERRDSYFHDQAQAALEWARCSMTAEQKRFLFELPFDRTRALSHFVDASAVSPERWDYVDSTSAAFRSTQVAGQTYVFCGHMHDQCLYFETLGGRMSEFRPVPGTPIPVRGSRRWLAVVGSVGQPRDRNPAAAYAIFDDVKREITFFRFVYDRHFGFARHARYPSAAHAAFDLRKPDEVELTSRSQWTTGTGLAWQMRNWWRGSANPLAGPMLASARAPTPIILIAVGSEQLGDARHTALQQAARRLITLNPDFRLMLVSAIRAARLGEGERIEDTASGRHPVHRDRLGAWVVPLGLPASWTSLDVVESADPAATILDLAQVNHLDMIVIGAPGPRERSLAWWRSVASGRICRGTL